MRPLQPIGLCTYRARATRLVRPMPVRGAVSLRRAGIGALAALLILAPDGLHRSEAEAKLTAVTPPVAAPLPPPVPLMVLTTAAGAPGYEYARRSVAAGTASAPVQPAALTIEDAWLSVFGGEFQLAAFIAHVAAANDLPPAFLLGLLRQESGLNHRAVSRAGAQGIAQFMPGTAGERGLADPFDPYEAIPKSAELLKEYRARFGNLGLAAAAYNAGPQRIRNWLSGRATLPAETLAYVTRITGRSADAWRLDGDRSTTAEFLRDMQRP
ncbi:lytic transglycosylase domain-containing protein [Methylobacterium oryzisoli]|uniref:lytic transglycosylase domain-containing protein n=1 Tax=Methylobacterium oryzisoli TaxID=3385502 RepID=UPI003892A1FA